MIENTKVPAEELVQNPGWMPHRLDMARQVISFGLFDRYVLSAASFLDYRVENAASGWAEASITDILAASTALPDARPAFLFHTSYCCSTLLSRALDRPGSVLALKEPEIIMGLSNAYRMAQAQTELDHISTLRNLILRLLARPHTPGERIVVKPTNAANNLIPILAGIGLPAILLYGDLRGFLTSVIKKGDPCKTLVRQIYRVYAMDKIGVSAIAQRDALALTDLQIAALVWRHQIELFNTALEASPAAQVRSLDFRMFLKNPVEALTAASEHLGFGGVASDYQSIVEGPLFNTDAKDGARTYNAQDRSDEEKQLMEQQSDALNLIEDWVFKLSLWPTTTRQLPKPLF